MKRIFIILFLVIVSIASGFSQSISMGSFRALETDLTANTAGTIEKDQNGETAALIKVVTTQTGFSFDGGALGIVKTIQKPGEVWVYVPRGLKKITISHPNLGVLRDQYFNIPIESARTYEMVLVTGTVETIVKQTRTSQYVVFQLNPANAIVELDGNLLSTESGIATKMMKFGTYDYRIQAPDYFPEAGKVTISDPINKHIVKINLKPNFAQVTIQVDNEAEIWVNGVIKGTGSWTGGLGAGTYEMEAKKSGYRSTSETCEIIVPSKPQTIHLKAPTPIYGEAEISSVPAMADIYIDGSKVGQTPMVIPNIIAGEHKIRITKADYADYTGIIIVKENEITNHSAILQIGRSSPITPDPQPVGRITPPYSLNKSFKITYNGVGFKCKAKNGYITITGFDTSAKEVIIPGKVQYEGQYFPVREIDTFINGNNYGAIKLVLEDGIEIIDNFSFVEFRKLVDVTLPSTIREIGKNAFRNNDGMKYTIPSKISEGALRSGNSISVR